MSNTTLDIRRVPEARQPYRRNGYSGPAITAFYWCVQGSNGKTIAIVNKLRDAKTIVQESGATIGKIIR